MCNFRDVLLGIISAANRDGISSEAKRKLIARMRQRSGYQLTRTTLLRESKVNLFHWTPQPLGRKRYPVEGGKEATFWHLVSSGPIEDDRLPDFRRLERIRWPRAIIDHAADASVLVWENVRRNDRRVCLWLEADDYLVVLAKRPKYSLLWTAYPVDRAHTRKKLRREYENAQKG